MIRRFALVSLLLLLLQTGCQAVEKITILHLNDLHARLLPDKSSRGGFAHIATAISNERSKNKNTIVLHAGDMVQGTPVSTLFDGVPVFEVGNKLGIDVHCLGNHEFDYGWEKILEFAEKSEAPIVCANVTNATGETLLRPSVVLSVGNLKIAVIGVITARLQSLTMQEKVGQWRASSVVESLRPVIANIHDDVDIVVVLAHMFDDEEVDVLNEVPDVDILVGGHNHGGREFVLDIDGRIGVKMRAYGTELGRLDIYYDREEKRIVNIQSKRIPVYASEYKADKDTLKLVNNWESKVSDRVDIKIGVSTQTMGKRELQFEIETAILEETGAEVAYMNLGGIRDSLAPGDIMARDIWNMLPFDNTLAEAEIRGSQLPEQLVERKNLKPSRGYRLVTNSFVASQLKDQGIASKPSELVLREVFIEWIKERGTLP